MAKSQIKAQVKRWSKAILGRTFWHSNFDTYGSEAEIVTSASSPEEANLVGSQVEMLETAHLPVFDIDYDAHLVPSTTEGHFHLYLNKAVSWKDLRRVIKAMAKAGLVQKGWADGCDRRGMATVRPPWVKKKEPEPF